MEYNDDDPVEIFDPNVFAELNVSDTLLEDFIVKRDMNTNDELDSVRQNNTTIELKHSVTGVVVKVPNNGRSSTSFQASISENDVDVEETLSQRESYKPENLNEQQRAVFDYVMNNQTAITILQAGPGTGKTFTMLTIAHYLTSRNRIPNVVIYKHD